MAESRVLLSISDVEERLGVSRTKLWRMIRDGELKVFSNPRDRRQKLLDLDEVRQVLEPTEIHSEEGKAAA